MARFGHSLMVTPKEGPGYDMSVDDHLVPDQGPDQMQHFWERIGDQQTANPLRRLKVCRLLGPCLSSQAFCSCSALACSAIKVAQTWATKERVTCRYHPVQLLTS